MFLPSLKQICCFLVASEGLLSSCVSLHLCIENSTQSGQAMMLQCCVSNYEMQPKEGKDKRRELVHFLMRDRTQSTIGEALQ